MADSKHHSFELNEAEVCFGIVGNIPKEFHSADLRAMFSNFINDNDESGGFKCFHFRHRPEFRQEQASTGGDKDTQVSATTCCVILVRKEKLQELIKSYHGKNWVDRKGKYFPSKAIISKIRVKAGKDPAEDHPYKTRQEKKDHCFTRRNLEFSQHDLRDLPELHPPPLMPNGNVGTPLSKFMELIRTCKLPPHVIKKLDLNFSLGKSKKKYSNVPLDYKSLEKRKSVTTTVTSIGDKRETVKELMHDGLQIKKASSSTYTETLWAGGSAQVGKASDSENEGVTTDDTHDSDNYDDDSNTRIGINSDVEDDVVEEWDRHESLHNDVTSQERTKERLFEEDIELKWEKGGSGLVFYTDAAFWKQQEEADFDEETADDWDVDMEIYENPDGGDKDSRDLLQMRLEDQWRKGNDITLSKIGGFEKHTKGFGSQVMKKQGWREGDTLGSSQVGIKEPVVAEGQFPKCKRGLGYYGEKLQRHVKRPRAERNVIISTIYDEPDNQEVNLFESWGPDKLKYVSNVEFVRGETTLK